MKATGGAPRKRGTPKKHTTARLEEGDRLWIQAEAKKQGITPPDFIHALCNAYRLPGTPQEQIGHLTAQLVFFQNELAAVARTAGKHQTACRLAQEKNHILAQRLRACLNAITSLPAELQRRLPDMIIARTKRAILSSELTEAERLVVL